MIKNKTKSLHLLLLLLMAFSTGYAQQIPDTLRYSTLDAEKVFLENNLPLLAERLNISQAEARILQTKAWPNPTFTLDEVQLYKNKTTENIPPLFGDFYRDRTFSAQIEQLVYTAGKRKKSISLELQHKNLAQTVFTDMLQSLKVEFRQNAAELQYLQQVQGDWQLQLNEVNKLLNSQQAQFQEGNISQVELFRLKALQISFEGEINERNEQLTEKQRSLKTLMNIDPKSFLMISDLTNDNYINKIKRRTLDELIGLVDNNASLKIARNQTKVSEAELVIQKANRVPDLTFHLSYDRNGSVMLNFVGLGVSMDLPFFDRNKGNIRAAQIEVQKSNFLEKSKISELNNSVVKSWLDLNRAIQLYQKIDKDYVAHLDHMTKAVAKNFAQHNISLLEFLDYFESFRESKEKYFEAIKNISFKKEELNYLTGTDL